MQRRHHYEQAFEEYVRDRRLPYVAVDEARKALLPEGASLRVSVGNDAPQRALKSFDMVLYGRDTNLIAEIKGRRIARRPARENTVPARSRLESWVTLDDLESLTAWERLFGPGFQAAFVFVYWCDELPPAALFEDVFVYRGRWYAIRAILVGPYARVMRTRSARWRTVHLSSADFDRLSVPLTGSPLRRDAALA